MGIVEKKDLWQVADTLNYELLKANAKKNRQNLTEAENVFWQIAKGSGLGQKCRRQYIIGPYIVDFFFRKSNLIIELDGGYHRPTKPTLNEELLSHENPITGDILTDFATKNNCWYNNPEREKLDKERQDWLEHMGYKLLRFTNEEVLFDIDNVINKIIQNLKL